VGRRKPGEGVASRRFAPLRVSTIRFSAPARGQPGRSPAGPPAPCPPAPAAPPAPLSVDPEPDGNRQPQASEERSVPVERPRGLGERSASAGQDCPLCHRTPQPRATPGMGSWSRRAACGSWGANGAGGRSRGCSEGNQGKPVTERVVDMAWAMAPGRGAWRRKARMQWLCPTPWACHPTLTLPTIPDGCFPAGRLGIACAHSVGCSPCRVPTAQGGCKVQGARHAGCPRHRVGARCRVPTMQGAHSTGCVQGAHHAGCPWHRVGAGCRVPTMQAAYGAGCSPCTVPTGLALLRAGCEAPDAGTSLASCEGSEKPQHPSDAAWH